VVVDWRIRRLVHRSGLNCVPDGGRVPPQGVGPEPQDVAGLPVPRLVRRAGSVDGHESPGNVRPRNKKGDLFYQGGAE
jgi:hypothetical protein